MRFIYFMMLFIGCAVSAQSLELKGVLDLTVPTGGNDGKALHLYVSEDIPDLSLYGIGVANNGGGTDGQEYTFPVMAASAGDHIFLPRTTTAMTSYFGNLDLFDIVLEDGIATQNGDDAIELFFNGEVIETFGDIDCAPATAVDCAGFPNYTDAWAYKSAGVWVFADANCSDDSTTSLTSNCPYPFLTEVSEPLTAPATPAPAPTHDAADVISIYGDTYTSIVTNFDPNWGQSGHTQVNTTFDVGGGNTVLAYPNFNYQGTELTTVNASAMEFLHVDIWTNADPTATTIQVSPINNGTGAGETLVTIDHVAGQWYGVDIPKSAFTGMTWNSVFQLKFAANGPGSMVPVDIYLDNIYFWKAPVELGAVATLSDLQVDGETIANFLAIDFDYTFEVPVGSAAIPQITATATDENADVEITQATMVPGNATVVVTSQNGLVENTYTVAFSFELLTQPSMAAPTPTHAAEDVISIYGDTYTNIATNYNPNWGQSGFGQVNPTFSVDEGNVVLAYPNFNYQGTELTTTNASAMEFLHVDIWTNADPNATIVQVSPINNGTGAGEILVTIEHVAEQWYSVDIPKSAFTGMTWDSVFQLKFAANGPGSTTPATIYLDNIYFWKAPMVMVPTTQVEGLCGQTLPTVNSKVFFDNVIGATEYTYSVTNMMTNEEQVIMSTNRFFYFADLESFELGTVYAVKGKAQVGGNYGEYGAVCNVTTPLMPPTSQLRNAYCNTTLTTISENIYANVVVGASMYKFKVANGMDEQEIERPRSRFSMAFATGIAPGMTYDVSVAVMINGVWGPYGNVCTITTQAALPTSQLRPQFCNANVATINSNFYASVRVGATAYKFKTMINGEEIEVVRPDSRCFMSAFAGAMTNQTYSIQVAVQIGGVWGEYGDACSLTTSISGKLLLTDGTETFDIKAYPNPFVNQITLSLSNENTQSDIMVYDMTGKLIQQVSTEQITLEIGNNWSKGIYLVQIVQGQETKNIRIVKQ
uniref:T9SS type A sorting domain-containing protein n=2 Tax=Flavobacterium sp. TaxID=239 RepID=UPI00404A87BC